MPESYRYSKRPGFRDGEGGHGVKPLTPSPEPLCPVFVRVDTAGRVFVADGGDDYNGAEHWVPIAE